jgi:transposase
MKNLTVTSLLREVAAHKGFRYVEVRRNAMAEDVLEVAVEPRKGSRGRCGKCGRSGPTYDHQSERMWRFVPLWAFVVFLVYTPRRIACRRCGIRAEKIPWASGKLRICDQMRLFLANWARRLSWRETASVFAVSWADVYGAVKWRDRLGSLAL